MKKIIDDIAKQIIQLGYEYNLTIYPKLLNDEIIRGFKLKIKNRFGITIKSKTIFEPFDKYIKNSGVIKNCEEFILFKLAEILTQFIITKVPEYCKEYELIKNKIVQIEELNKKYNIDYKLVPIFVNDESKGFDFYIYHSPKKFEIAERLKVQLDCLLTQCQIDLYYNDRIDLRKKYKDDEQEIFDKYNYGKN